MNLTVINSDGRYVIDSREVAEMTDKRHDHLIRDIDGYVEILSKSQNPNMGNGFSPIVYEFFTPSSYESGNPLRKYRSYLLTRKGCDMVANKMTGEKGVLFTAAYVTKFEEMERQPKLPQNMAEALRLAADLWEENQTLLPKGQAYDQFMSAQNSMTMGEVAKTLGIGRNTLFALLKGKGILMKNNVPYQEYMKRGYFEVIFKPVRMGEEITNKPQTYVAPKGVEYIGKILEEVRV